ncbi:hypothetical protein BKA66DRAFT_572531 [Pyrenochaeta sp. MPI-SDFR-AT-0127]|nr:hypothetical protein BKA66DRAFT_572531 [Pyrenochaeta sp. MPI-SDFR-AT-0127]
MGMLLRQPRAPLKPLPLSSVAKQLTKYLFGEIQLPPFLQQYGHLMLVFTGGAAAATGLYSFFQRHRQNRAKIQLAVFHVIRMAEHHTTLEEWLQNPHMLIAQMDREVMRMVGAHLTQNEAESAMRELKRKVWTTVDEYREMEIKEKKKRKKNMQAKEDGRGQNVQTRYEGSTSRIMFTLPSSSDEEDIEAQLKQLEQELDTSMLDIDDHPPPPNSPPSQHHTPHISATQTPLLPSFQDHTEPSTDGNLPNPTPVPQRPQNPTPQAARNGYGFSYSDESMDSRTSSSSSKSPNSPNSPLAKKSMSMLEVATLRASGKLSYSSPAFPQPQGTNPPSANRMKRRLATSETESQSRKRRTRLFPIHEGDSPQESPLPGTSQYRVNESRTFYRGVVKARQERQLAKNLLQPQVEAEQVLQEDLRIKEEELDLPVLKSSGREEHDEEVQVPASDISLSPEGSIENHSPSDLLSPSLASLFGNTHTPEPHSPVLAPSSSPSLIEGQQAPVNATPSLVQQSASPQALQSPLHIAAQSSSSPIEVKEDVHKPSTPSPPKRKDGRAWNVYVDPQTPRPAQTPGTRKSARKSAFKGMYGK